MPFKNEDQRKACYAQKSKGKNGSWDCNVWNKITPKNIPEHSKKASWIIKSAAKSFNATKIPVVSPQEKERRLTQPLVQDAIAQRVSKVQKYMKQKSQQKTASIKWNLNLTTASWGV